MTDREQEIRKRLRTFNDSERLEILESLTSNFGPIVIKCVEQLEDDRAWLLAELDRVRKMQRTPGTMEVCEKCGLFKIELDRDNDSTNWSTCESVQCPIKSTS